MRRRKGAITPNVYTMSHTRTRIARRKHSYKGEESAFNFPDLLDEVVESVRSPKIACIILLLSLFFCPIVSHLAARCCSSSVNTTFGLGSSLSLFHVTV